MVPNELSPEQVRLNYFLHDRGQRFLRALPSPSGSGNMDRINWILH